MSEKDSIVIRLRNLSIVCFVICLPLHAFSAHKDPGVSSWVLLLFGPIELGSVPRVSLLVALSWYANPLLFCAWFSLSIQKYRIASILGAVAAWFSLSFLLAQNVAMNGAVTDTVESYGLGYWFWVASILLAFAGALKGRLEHPMQPPREMNILKWRHDVLAMAMLISLGIFSTYGPTIDWSFRRELKLHNVVTFASCTSSNPEEDISKGVRGNRAFLSDDGLSAVLQCPDGSVQSWQAGKQPTRSISETTLFSAAKRAGILRADLRCPRLSVQSEMCRTGSEDAASMFPICRKPENFKEYYEGEGDCDVVDQTDDGAAFILREEDSVTSFIAMPASNSNWIFDVSQHSGVLMPRSGPAKKVLFADTNWNLNSVSLDKGRVRHVLDFPNRGSFAGVGETAWAVAYSPAYELLVVSFSGAFLGPTNMAYVRAYSLKGREQWNISATSPSSDSGFSADTAYVKLFANGRYATLAKTDPNSPFEVVDLSDGRVIGYSRGIPIAASAKATRFLLKTSDGKYVLEEWLPN